MRRLVFSLGYRYHLHARDLPGTPDLVFRRRRKAVFVHGCFWHQHECRLGRRPKSRLDFWHTKLTANKNRDAAVLMRLHEMGWAVLVIWECELSNQKTLIQKVTEFLGDPAL